MGLISKFQSRLELRRLEKKYTTRRKSDSIPAAAVQYVDGEYTDRTSTSSNPTPSNHQHRTQEYRSSSASFAASKHQPDPTTSPVVVSFASSPPQSSKAPLNLAAYNPSSPPNVAKHSSWQSLAPSSPRNSTFTTAGDQPASPALSRNSKGQSWEPPKHGWGGDGTDAFRADKREFRFDVERDRRSVVR